jgi:hypothetical protein
MDDDAPAALLGLTTIRQPFRLPMLSPFAAPQAPRRTGPADARQRAAVAVAEELVPIFRVDDARAAAAAHLGRAARSRKRRGRGSAAAGRDRIDRAVAPSPCDQWSLVTLRNSRSAAMRRTFVGRT